MRKNMVLFVYFLLLAGMMATAAAQVGNFAPVTQEMLRNPSPNDWLMVSRTYDHQRFSPLDQINKQNVGGLRMVWARGMAQGAHEHIPLVYQGVMYVVNPVAVVHALDATTGDLLWEYRRRMPDDLAEHVSDPARSRNLAIFGDMVYFASPEGYIVALDARTGALRWETKAHDYKLDTRHTSGPILAEDKVISGRSCSTRSECFIVAHDARTGRELWKFYTTAAPGEPGGDTWGAMPADERVASPWGLPGSYDPVRRLVYWGIANPTPYTRIKRHNGNVDAVSRSAPAELYSNSTVALDPDTGRLAWYYQHLPGDDWDFDNVQERILLRTRINPESSSVKWINPRIPRDTEREVVVSVGEPGGLWVLDRAGEFVWATPFPYDVPEFYISRIDVETGKTYINADLLLEREGDRHVICFENTKSYWPMAYHPGKNSLYIPFHDSCLDTTASNASSNGHDPKIAVPRPGVAPDAFAGIAKVNMATGRMDRIYSAPISGNGAMLATAGDLIFWGDLDRRFRAMDADTGAVLWETVVGGIVQMSTITYAVNGKQYVAVMTGRGAGGTRHPLRQVRQLGSPITPPEEHNAIYVFALP